MSTVDRVRSYDRVLEDGGRRLRTLAELCTRSEFLLKVAALALLLAAVVAPCFFGLPAYSNTMIYKHRLVVKNVFYAATTGAAGALVVLIVLVVLDEDRYTVECFFLLVYTIVLLVASVTQLLYIVYYRPAFLSIGHADWSVWDPIRRVWDVRKNPAPWLNETQAYDYSHYDSEEKDDDKSAQHRRDARTCLFHGYFAGGAASYFILLFPGMLFLAAVLMLLDFMRCIFNENRAMLVRYDEERHS